MHALVPAILFGMSRPTALDPDSQPQPPDRQLAEPIQVVGPTRWLTGSNGITSVHETGKSSRRSRRGAHERIAARALALGKVGRTMTTQRTNSSNVETTPRRGAFTRSPVRAESDRWGRQVRDAPFDGRGWPATHRSGSGDRRHPGRTTAHAPRPHRMSGIAASAKRRGPGLTCEVVSGTHQLRRAGCLAIPATSGLLRHRSDLLQLVSFNEDAQAVRAFLGFERREHR